MVEEEYELIITEKPKVSERIAKALASGAIKRSKYKNITYYEISRKGKRILLAPAVGHVFTLQQDPGQTDYPVFKISWVPSHKASKGAAYTKPYVETLQHLAKNATTFMSATDFDVEGELIGYNILKYLCPKGALEQARRMKFSALTEGELERAYEHALAHVVFAQAEAGVARHTLDWLWGVNVSRALSHAYKGQTSHYVTLSAGRVQTPTLKVLDDREQEIKAFKSDPFWVLSANLRTEPELQITHEVDKFWKKEDADQIYSKCKDAKEAVLKTITRTRSTQKQPMLFNLSDLQSESYRVFRYTPKRTQQLAQSLYDQGLITYPRTSSQKLPAGLDVRELLEKLRKQKEYANLVADVLSFPNPKPTEGPKSDPAHPCILPTGEKPQGLTPEDFKLYDMIVKHFFASFGKPAVRETQTLTFDVAKERFLAKGTRTVEKNWHLLYEPYVKQKEEDLPELKENQLVPVTKVSNDQKETQPPKRYSQASVVKKMEQLGIGTKATRAQILQTLYDRNYVQGQQIQVTEFGSRIVKTLTEHVSELTSEQLTRRFEEEVVQIQEGNRDAETVIAEAQVTLEKLLTQFKAHTVEIGSKIAESYQSAQKEQRTLGTCPKCAKDLIIRVSKASKKQFVGCSGYPDCDCSYPLPQSAKIVKVAKPCPHDNLPVVEVIRRGKRKFSMCIDPKCPSKEDWGKNKKSTPKTAK